MLFAERKNENDKMLQLTEYLASFWNAEAVKKIRESREKASTHKFATDEELEQQMVTKAYKEDPLIKAIQKIRESEGSNNYFNKIDNSKIKQPTDLSSLSNLIRKI